MCTTNDKEVLFLEDDPQQERFVLILQDAGYVVTHVDGINDCLEQLREKAFDLLLVDIMKKKKKLAIHGFSNPLEAGYHLITAVRGQIEELADTFTTDREVPIIVLTGVPSDQVVEMCENLIERDNVFLKPFAPEDVVERMQTLLRD